MSLLADGPATLSALLDERRAAADDAHDEHLHHADQNLSILGMLGMLGMLQAKVLAKQMGQCFRSGYLTIQIALQLLQVFCLLLFFLLELLQGLAGGFTGSNAIGLRRGGQGQKNDSSTEP